MFICNDCGAIFDNPEVEYETHGLDSPPYERWLICPNCRSSSFEEALLCTRCYEYVTELTDDLCDECYSELYG